MIEKYVNSFSKREGVANSSQCRNISCHALMGHPATIMETIEVV